MDKETFWNVIGEAGRCMEGGWRAVLEAAERKLMEFPAADIARWEEIRWVYMKLAYRNDLWVACAVARVHCTDDGFTDFRSWLIFQGRDVYMQVVRNPDSLAEVEIPGEGVDFEEYGYVAARAYAHKKAVETRGLEAILTDYRAWAGKKRKASAKEYLWTLEDEYDIYEEGRAHPLGPGEKEGILAEAALKPDIDSWDKGMLPGILPRLCRKHGIGPEGDMP